MIKRGTYASRFAGGLVFCLKNFNYDLVSLCLFYNLLASFVSSCTDGQASILQYKNKLCCIVMKELLKGTLVSWLRTKTSPTIGKSQSYYLSVLTPELNRCTTTTALCHWHFFTSDESRVWINKLWNFGFGIFWTVDILLAIVNLAAIVMGPHLLMLTSCKLL